MRQSGPFTRPVASRHGLPEPRAPTAAQPTINRLSFQLATRMPAKLAVSWPTDPHEREADRVAEHVTRLPAPAVQRACNACGAGGPPCPKCQTEEGGILRRKADPLWSRLATGFQAHRPPHGAEASVQRALRSSGHPLDSATRIDFESRFGADFSSVRVHTDASAEDAAASVHAKAFTVGADIVFARGRYEPGASEGRRLLAHELTHAVQQGSAPASTVQRAPDDAADMEQALLDEIEVWQTDADQDDDLMLRAYAARMTLLLTFHTRPPLKTQDDLDAFVAQCKELAQTELDTLGVFPPPGVELALAFYPKGFPLTWSGRVHAALSLGADPSTIFAEWLISYNALVAASQTLATEIYAHGLPVPYEDRSRLADFKLRIADSKAEKPSAVRDYAQESVKYMQLKWVSVFAFTWETIVDQIASAVADGTRVVNYLDWQSFVENKQAILRDLPARAVSRLAGSEEEAQQIQTDALDLANAALLTGMASGLISIFGILSAWSDATALFDTALAAADQSVAAASSGARIVTALQWAWDNGYFGGAAAEWAQNLIDHGEEILTEIALILILGMIPYVNILVAVYLVLTLARDVVHMVADLASAFNAVMEATSVGQLQEGAARLAQVLTNGAIFIVIVLITEGIGKAAARLRKGTAELRAADKTLTEEAAARKAMERLPAEERKAFEQGPAKVAKKFEEFAGACSLGSINCRVTLPKHVTDPAGAYPNDFSVPMPKGPFTVQKSALSTASRVSKELQSIARANRKNWPAFDKALAKAEKAGKDWPTDANGEAWQVHHVKPVFMGGGSDPANLFPLPIAVHQKYTNWWNAVHRAFKNRFTEQEWDLIYMSAKDVPGSRVPTTPKR